MRIDEALKAAVKMLEKSVCRPRLEAELLLAHALGKERLFLHLNPKNTFKEKEFFQMVKRRATGEPLEYIVKRVSFYSEDFFIDYGALIPRPETELLIDELSKELKGDEKVAEIGVGSGIVSIILKKKFPNLAITATDISRKALDIAKKNAQKHGVDIELVNTSFLEGLRDDFDVIVSNPPYIKKDFELERVVRDFEPHEALFGGEEGDETLREIIKIFKKSRVKVLACEMGYDQKARLEPLLKDYDNRFYKDLSGLDRGFIAKKE